MITDMPLHPNIASGWMLATVASEEEDMNPWTSYYPSPLHQFGSCEVSIPAWMFFQEVYVFMEDGAKRITS